MNRFLILGLFLLTLPTLWSQKVQQTSIPGSEDELVSSQPIDRMLLPAPEMVSILKEDSIYAYGRFAVPIPIDINLQNNGNWTNLADSGRIWRIQIELPRARALMLQFEQLDLPEGSTLQVYASQKTNKAKSYTQQHIPSSGRFISDFISGEKLYVTLYEPSQHLGKARLRTGSIYYAYAAYRPPADRIRPFAQQGFGESLPCHLNINCPEAAAWQDAKRSVVRVLRVFEEGAGWCSGSLMNNTAEDGRPLILSAFHCQQNFTPLFDLWRFDFNYEMPLCANDTIEPGFNSIWGCSMRAGRIESDFLLLELDKDVPLSYQARFNGWDRRDGYEPATGTLIQQPNGDVKKYAHEEDTVRIQPTRLHWGGGFYTPPEHHLKAVLDEGTMEGGSSGSPLLDPAGRVVGQLHGGRADCSRFITYSGRLQKSWAEGDSIDQRLREWLDPLATDTLLIDALDAPDTLDKLSIKFTDPFGRIVTQLRAVISCKGISDTLMTDSLGCLEFDSIPVGDSCVIRYEKDRFAKNGVSVFDLLAIQKHILLIDTFQQEWQLLAADVDGSGKINVLDLLHIQLVILNERTHFPGRPSWQLQPSQTLVDELPIKPGIIQIQAIKTGDVTGDANPLE